MTLKKNDGSGKYSTPKVVAIVVMLGTFIVSLQALGQFVGQQVDLMRTPERVTRAESAIIRTDKSVENINARLDQMQAQLNRIERQSVARRTDGYTTNRTMTP